MNQEYICEHDIDVNIHHFDLEFAAIIHRLPERFNDSKLSIKIDSIYDDE